MYHLFELKDIINIRIILKLNTGIIVWLSKFTFIPALMIFEKTWSCIYMKILLINILQDHKLSYK